MITRLGRIGQIGIVVNDLEMALKEYWEKLGIGPWKIWTYGPPTTTEMTYYGKPAVQMFKGAETIVGDLNVELLMHLDGDTIYRDFLNRKVEGGLHHVSIYTNDIEPTLDKFRRAGIGIIQSGKMGKDEFYYLDTERIFGIILEVQTSYGEVPPERIFPSEK